MEGLIGNYLLDFRPFFCFKTKEQDIKSFYFLLPACCRQACLKESTKERGTLGKLPVSSFRKLNFGNAPECSGSNSPKFLTLT
jgi:hypothetical protein